jgi:hypothetical protein
MEDRPMPTPPDRAEQIGADLADTFLASPPVETPTAHLEAALARHDAGDRPAIRRGYLDRLAALARRAAWIDRGETVPCTAAPPGRSIIDLGPEVAGLVEDLAVLAVDSLAAPPRRGRLDRRRAQLRELARDLYAAGVTDQLGGTSPRRWPVDILEERVRGEGGRLSAVRQAWWPRSARLLIAMDLRDAHEAAQILAERRAGIGRSA